MTYDVKNLPAMISLGKAGENAITEIELDVSAWAKDYPKANFAVVVERADGACYPVEITHSDGLLTWLVTANETIKGYGKLEVRMLDGDVLAKSATTATYVSPSLDTGDTPEPTVPDWVNDLLQKIQDLIEHGVTPEQIEAAVTEYLDKHPIDAVTREQCLQIVTDYVAAQGFPSFADIDREVESYVTAHKDELKGDRGEQGIPGPRGADGYTPQKGKDYFDGKDGTNGKDGYTPIKGVDYFDGKDGQNGKDGKDGENGKDGKNYSVTVVKVVPEEFSPNVYYELGEQAEIYISLAEPEDNAILNEYMVEFISGAEATNFSYDVMSITFMSEPTIEANKKYQISIVNGIGLLVGVDYE